jgi:biotin operon repressor
MNAQKATPVKGQISGARVVPYQPETAKRFGGGARGRTLAIIYRQLSYWSKYAKWTGSRGRKFFYKSQKELAGELGYSEKTVYRAIKALKELGLVVVEQLHKHYWRQVSFYYLPQSPFAAAEPEAPTPTPEHPVVAPSTPARSCSTTTKPSSRNAPAPSGSGGTAVHPAAAATAKSIRTRGGTGFGHFAQVKATEYKPLIKQSLQTIVERCYAMRDMMIQNEQEQTLYGAT